MNASNPEQLNILTELNHYGLIAVEGEDAMSFLQNQLSNDLKLIDESHSQLSSYSSPKGRMFAIFRLFQWGQRYYLRMPRELIEPLLKRLGMFVLRSKVELSIIKDELQQIGVAGPNAEKILAAVIDNLPQTVNETNGDHKDYKVLRVPGTNRFEIYAQNQQIQTIWPQLNQHLTLMSSDIWALLDICNGIPNIYTGTSEHFVPQMTNLQLIDGISFKKGCYPGQEVVARMQYLGKLKRRMYLVQLNTSSPPEPGTPIVSIADNKNHETGEIVDARIHLENKCNALAVLQISSVDQELRLSEPDGPTIEILELPYPIT